MQNLRYALRTLAKQPLFTLVAVATLTLGIGANAAVFSLVYQALLQPLPVAHADRLVFVWNRYGKMNLSQASVSIPDYLDRRGSAAAIEDATLFTSRMANLNEAGTPEQVRAMAVTPSFFSTLGIQPAYGRGFTEDDATPDADHFVVLSHGLWASRFGADRDIVGRDIRVNGVQYRVVGVMPQNFDVLGPDVALFVPFSFTAAQRSDDERGNEFSQMIARLRPGATVEQLNSQMATITDAVAARLPASAGFMRSAQFGGFALPLRDQLAGDVRPALWLMQGCAIFVLFIACANVANLLLMRATQRQRELAIRTTLGAGSWHLLRQLVTEGLVLASVGGVAGLAVGLLGAKALLALAGDRLPGSPHASLDPAVLGGTFAMILLTGLVFGVVPAIGITRGRAADYLRDDTNRGTSSRRTGLLKSLLVIGEIAAALVLLAGAGLLIKSYLRLQHVDAGFSPAGVLTAEVALPAAKYPDPATRAEFWKRALERARAVPGVTAAGLTTNVPFNGRVSSGSYGIIGRAQPEGEPGPHGRQEIVGGDYFRAMNIPLHAGRLFDGRDSATAEQVVIVDDYFVRKYFPESSALGHQITRGGPTTFTIVGVVGTINAIDLAEPVTKERLYYPAAQAAPRNMALVLKTSLAPGAVIAPLRAAVRDIDAEQPLAAIRTLDYWMGRSLQTRTTPTMLLTVFGALALTLAAIGVYGVLAFSVAQRTREFGVRQALGADAASILGLVFREGLKTVGLGIVVGIGGALALATALRSQLYGVSAHDASVLAGVTFVLLLVAILACWIPARRATRVNPLVALRM